MIVRWEDCIRRAFAAVALLAVISLFEGGLAQDAMPQPNPDHASSPAKANAAGPSYLEPLNPGTTNLIFVDESSIAITNVRVLVRIPGA